MSALPSSSHAQPSSTITSAGQSVKLYIYDLSRGMARAMSAAFLGTQLDAIWYLPTQTGHGINLF